MEQSTENGSPVAGAAQAQETHQYIAFSVGNREFGVDIMAVREIRGWSGTTAIPNAPAAVLGVVNLRGTIVPVLDLRSCFGITPIELTRTHVVFIVKVANRTIGLVVDSVSDILMVRNSDIQPIRELDDSNRDSAVSQIIVLDKRLVGVINLEKLIGQTLNGGLSHKGDQAAA